MDIERYREQQAIQAKRLCTLKDGTMVSVQASEFHYCSPRKDNADKYSKVEAWFWRPDRRFKDGKHMLTKNPLAFLPAGELMKMINTHGGIVSGELPPLDLGEE